MDLLTVILPVLVGLCAAGVLAWLALRRGGLRPAGICACGYSLRDNTTGICPECGRPADEGRAIDERWRLLLAGRRLAYWVLAVVLVAAPMTALAGRLLRARQYADCRALLASDTGVFASAELVWRVDESTRTAAWARVTLTGLTGKPVTRAFSGSGAAADVEAWAAGLAAASAAPETARRACRDLGDTVAAVLAGSRMVLVGSPDWKPISSPAVTTVEKRAWPQVVVVMLCAGAAVWGGRLAVRRAMQ